jgi:hypothetical protein
MGIGFHYFPQITTFLAVLGFSLLVAGADFLRRRSAFRALASGGPDEMDQSIASNQPIAFPAESETRVRADEPTVQLFRSQEPAPVEQPVELTEDRVRADEPTVQLFRPQEPAPVEQPVELTEDRIRADEPTVQLFLSREPAPVEQPTELPEPHRGGGHSLQLGDFIPLQRPVPKQRAEKPAPAAEPSVQLFLSQEPAPVEQPVELQEPHRGHSLRLGDFIPLQMPLPKQRAWSPSDRHVV